MGRGGNFGTFAVGIGLLAASADPLMAVQVPKQDHCRVGNPVIRRQTTIESGPTGVARRRKTTYAESMTQPDASIADLFAGTAVASWKQNLDRLDRILAAVSDDDLQKEVAPGRNRLFYLLGHLAAVHDRMLPLLRLGARLHPELDEPFLTQADRMVPDTITPAALRTAWTEVNSALTAAIEALPAAAWLERHDAVTAEDFAKEPLRNRLAVLLSRSAHVQFHTGQIRLVVKPA